MKINKKLLVVLIIASLAPPFYFRIKEWLDGKFDSTYAFLESLLIYSLISLVVTLTISWVILSILHWLNFKLPWNENILKRLLAEIGITTPVSLGLGFIFANLTYYLVAQEDQEYSGLVFSYLSISIIMNFVLVAISDWFYFFDRWKASLIENEKALTENETLQKEKISAQYEALKNQINPHFLFNSLNVLSSIIHSDPDKAEEFVDEFANLYRYILEHHEENTVDLKSEMSVAKSYAYLQEIRFGKAVVFAFDEINDRQSALKIFPLSIQTILENAVKHNRASIDSPLHVEVFFEADSVIIKNNLQARNEQPHSTGIGTQNLISRYRVLGLIPKFEKTATHYIATLPLIE